MIAGTKNPNEVIVVSRIQQGNSVKTTGVRQVIHRGPGSFTVLFETDDARKIVIGQARAAKFKLN